jgi:hypothetical protein
MDDRVAALTVKVVLPVTVPDAALIVVLPALADVATPPAAIVATAVFDDDHVAVVVRFRVLPSE